MTDVVKVKLNDMELIWLRGEENTGPLIPPGSMDDVKRWREHADATALHSAIVNSYASVNTNGEIRQYGITIGNISELKTIDAFSYEKR